MTQTHTESLSHPLTHHRSLDWCCQVELLLLVGAPQQAFERISANLFSSIEWFEKNVLGWDIPGEDDMIPMYQNIALYYPEEHAYTFDQYKCVCVSVVFDCGMIRCCIH